MQVAVVATALGVRALHRARRTRPEPLPEPPRGQRRHHDDYGLLLHVQSAGPTDAAVTVVFVHGLLARTLEWDMQWQHLANRVRLVRYDHRNHGRSEHSGEPVDIHTLSRDLAAVLTDAVPTGPVVLVGHSTGGMTVLALAEDQPELFASRVVGVALIASGQGTPSLATARRTASAGSAAITALPVRSWRSGGRHQPSS